MAVIKKKATKKEGPNSSKDNTRIKKTKVTVKSKSATKADIKPIHPIAEGNRAPFFKAKNQQGKEVSLDDFKGKKLVLYFYPKDDTPTCTKEACNLRDNYQWLLKQGYAVVGISADTEQKHDKFVKKYNLPFDLLADTDKKIINAYGVWGPKLFMGRISDSIHRISFIINEAGIIERVIRKVESANHAEQIVEEM